MPFCIKCGAENQGDIKFCPECGNPVSARQTSLATDVKNHNTSDRSVIKHQMENMRNFIGVFFGVGLISVIYFLISGNINPLTSTAVIILGIFITQTRNYTSAQNENTFNILRNIFYIFVAMASLGLIYAVLMWGFYTFLILELMYFLIMFYLMNQYVLNAQMIIRS